MASTSKLIGIALTSAGVVGAGAGTYYSLKSNSPSVEKTSATINKSKISDLITSEGRTLLDDTDANLDIKFKLYEKSFQSLVTLTKNDKDGLKEWCSKTLDKEVEISKKDEENSDFQKALKLCTKPTNREKIETGTKTIAGKEDWGKIKTNYAEAGNTDKIIASISKTTAKEGQIEEWCSKTLDKEVLEDEHKLADAWCTKPQV